MKAYLMNRDKDPSHGVTELWEDITGLDFEDELAEKEDKRS